MGRTEKTIVAALVVITLLITLFFLLGEGMIHRDGKAVSPSPASSPEQFIVPPDPPEPAALATLEAFFEATDLAGKLAFVRDRAKVQPMMEDYHRHREHPFPSLGRISKGKLTLTEGNPMVFFEVEPFSGPRYPVAVIWDGRRFAVDWESLTAYGTIDWSEFVGKQPEASHTFRVYVQAAATTEQIPGTPAGSVAFRIGHRDDPESIIALANSPVAALLVPLVIRRRVPVILEIAWKPVGPGGMRIPEIVKFVASGWSS